MNYFNVSNQNSWQVPFIYLKPQSLCFLYGKNESKEMEEGERRKEKLTFLYGSEIEIWENWPQEIIFLDIRRLSCQDVSLINRQFPK